MLEAAAIVVDAAMLLLHCLCNICPCVHVQNHKLTTATMIEIVVAVSYTHLTLPTIVDV